VETETTRSESAHTVCGDVVQVVVYGHEVYVAGHTLCTNLSSKTLAAELVLEEVRKPRWGTNVDDGGARGDFFTTVAEFPRLRPGLHE
jgi:hypothetical protein